MSKVTGMSMSMCGSPGISGAAFPCTATDGLVTVCFGGAGLGGAVPRDIFGRVRTARKLGLRPKISL